MVQMPHHVGFGVMVDDDDEEVEEDVEAFVVFAQHAAV